MASKKHSRQSALGHDDDLHDLYLDCKAVYLSVMDDLNQKIRSQDQLQLLLQQAGRNPSRRAITKHWSNNGTTSLAFDDFVDICKKEPMTKEDDLLKAFRQIDINGDGYLSHSELSRVMTSKGEKMTKEEVREMIDEVDENKDGKLDYKEFCQLVLQTSNECKKLARQKMERKTKGKSHDSPSPRVSSRDSKSPRVDAPSPRARKSHRGSTNSLGEKRRFSSHADEDDDSSDESDEKDPPKPQPRPRAKADDRPKSPVASKKTKLPEPKTLKEWKRFKTRGCLHLDEDGKVVSHKYELVLKEDTNIWLTVKPMPLKTTSEMSKAPVDVGMMLMDSSGKLVTLTEQRDTKGVYCTRCDLQRGTYDLLPFSTGCRLKKRKTNPKVESKLIKKDGDKYTLTKGFKEALNEIFDIYDLDQNGSLSRNEFNWYNLRTSGEEVADDEWAVAEENIELSGGEITKKGFIQLNQMEADDNDGDTDDLWVTLSSMGYNKGLIQDEACPFLLDIFIEDSDSAKLNVNGFTTASEVEAGITEAAMNKGESSRVGNNLTLHTYVTDFRATYVIENKCSYKTSMKVDCGKSRNVNTNFKDESTVSAVDIPARSSAVAVHLLPTNERLDWIIRCETTIS